MNRFERALAKATVCLTAALGCFAVDGFISQANAEYALKACQQVPALRQHELTCINKADANPDSTNPDILALSGLVLGAAGAFSLVEAFTDKDRS